MEVVRYCQGNESTECQTAIVTAIGISSLQNPGHKMKNPKIAFVKATLSPYFTKIATRVYKETYDLL